MSTRNHRKKSYESYCYIIIECTFCDVSFAFVGDVVFVPCEVEKLCRVTIITDLGNNPCLFRARAEVVVQSM